MSDKDNVIYFYTPENEGDFIGGIPQRDLTQADLDAMSPVELREVYAIDHPGHRLYTKAGKEGKAAPEMTRDDLNKEAKRLGIATPEQFKNKVELQSAIDAASPPPQVDVPVVTDTGEGLAVTGSEAVSPGETPNDEESTS